VGRGGGQGEREEQTTLLRITVDIHSLNGGFWCTGASFQKNLQYPVAMIYPVRKRRKEKLMSSPNHPCDE